MKKARAPKTRSTRDTRLATSTAEAIDVFKRLLREMQMTTRNRLLAGRPPAETERDVERAMKAIIRSWVKPLRRIERIMERTYDDSSRRLDDLVRINNWCAQDLAENAYVGDASGNYEKILHGLCDICRPHMAWAGRLKKYGGPYEE